MVSFEIFVKAMPPSLSDLKVLPSFCFAFKIPDDRAVTNVYLHFHKIYCNGQFLVFVIRTFVTTRMIYEYDAKVQNNFDVTSERISPHCGLQRGNCYYRVYCIG